MKTNDKIGLVKNGDSNYRSLGDIRMSFMIKLQKFAERWARYVSTDRSALKDSMFGLTLGLALLFLYLLRSPEHPVVLVAAVFVIMLAIKRFERAGFILLLHRSKEQITHTTGGTDNGKSSAPAKAGGRSSGEVPLPGKG